MRFQLVWGYRDFFGYDETIIKESKDLDMLEKAQNLLGNMDDDELCDLLEITQEVINDGMYFRIKTV